MNLAQTADLRISMQPGAHFIKINRLWCAASSVLIAMWIGVMPVYAQDAGIPGLVVTAPPEPSRQTVPQGTQTFPSAARSSAEAARPTAKNERQSTNSTNQRPAKPKPKPITGRKHGVAILVNDEPITHHEIDQRARFLSSNSPGLGKKVRTIFQSMIKRKSTSQRLRSILEETVKANPGKSREQILAIFEKRKDAYAKQLQSQAVAQARKSLLPAQHKQAQEELIEERLKMQEAKRLNILASMDEVDRSIENVAKRNKMTPKQFYANLKRSGVESQTIKDRIRAQISWAGVIRREYGRTISVNMADIDSQVAKMESRNDIKLHLHKVTLKLPNALSQNVMAAKLREGERLKANFSDCRSTKVLVRNVQDAVFEDLGQISAQKISEPARSLLLQAKDGDMLPPLTQREGIVLYAICGRNADTAKANARSAIQRREFDIMAKRHIADLKRDAHIEYR